MSGKNLAPTFDCVADASFDSGGSAASEEHLCGWEFQCSLDGSSNRAASGSSGPSFYGLQIKNIARSGSSEAPFIWGQDELDDANNLTAQEDILFLEKNMNIEIVDFNHSKKLAAEVELQFWKDLMYDCRFLGAAVQKIWEDMLANLNDSVHRAKQSGSCGPLLHVMEMALSQCYVNLEAALERCQKPHV
ncbi:hypothetical protein BS78_08G078700 [Paspalum vaginatum]|nr:hypothetical protein BS78_08G078700 [Paspalum vaginatum]